MANESNLQLTQILMNFTDVGGGGEEGAEGGAYNPDKT